MTTATIEAPLDLRAAWRRWRWPLALGVAVLGVAVGLAAIENAPPRRPLDPGDASPAGGRALAQLIRDRGVDITTATTVPPATVIATATVFVPDPASLTQGRLTALSRSPATVVVIAPARRELVALGIPSRAVDSVSARTVAPGCAFEPAVVAGTIRFGGLSYGAGPGLTSCYPAGAGAGVVVHDRGPGTTVVVGSPGTFTNSALADEGDAALALGLLSSRPDLVWMLPRPPTQAAADAQHKGLLELLPSRILWTVLQLAVVVGLVGWWRGRRIGPVIGEPLPVIVRAGETVRGKARLLRAAHARGTAAGALRTAAARRAADLVGLGPDATEHAVVTATARRCGLDERAVASLLYGADPPDDVSLVKLADALDDFEAKVRRT